MAEVYIDYSHEQTWSHTAVIIATLNLSQGICSIIDSMLQDPTPTFCYSCCVLKFLLRVNQLFLSSLVIWYYSLQEQTFKKKQSMDTILYKAQTRLDLTYNACKENLQLCTATLMWKRIHTKGYSCRRIQTIQKLFNYGKCLNKIK